MEVREATHIIKSDFMPARNSGTPPVKLLFDKSLIKHLDVNMKYAINVLILLRSVQNFEILTILLGGLDSECQTR